MNNKKKNQRRSYYNENVTFLKDRGLGFIDRGDFIGFMESKDMSFNKYLITQELFDEYLKQEELKKQQKEEAKFRKKEEKRIKKENDKFLKDYGMGSSSRNHFKSFMEDKNLSINKILITEDLIMEYMEQKSDFGDYNEKFLKDYGLSSSDRYDFKKFMESKNMSFNKHLITYELFYEYLKQKEIKKQQEEERRIKEEEEEELLDLIWLFEMDKYN